MKLDLLGNWHILFLTATDRRRMKVFIGSWESEIKAEVINLHPVSTARRCVRWIFNQDKIFNFYENDFLFHEWYILLPWRWLFVAWLFYGINAAAKWIIKTQKLFKFFSSEQLFNTFFFVSNCSSDFCLQTKFFIFTFYVFLLLLFTQKSSQ